MNRRVSMPLSDWDRLVNRARPFADRAGMTPILAGVHLFERDGRLYAEATDRYRLAVVAGPKADPAEDDPRVVIDTGFDVVIRLAALDDLARVTKVPARLRGMQSISLTDTPEGLAVTVIALPGLGDISFTIPTGTNIGTYPPLAHLMTAALSDPQSTGPVLFNPAFLATYAQVVDRNTPVEITPHGLRPALIRVGDDFLSALVPIKPGQPATAAPDLFSFYLPEVTS